MLGPGKYDDLCTDARNKAEAEGAVLIVMNGKHGNGFSCQASVIHMMALPAALRMMADQIDADIRNGFLKK